MWWFKINLYTSCSVVVVTESEFLRRLHEYEAGCTQREDEHLTAFVSCSSSDDVSRVTSPHLGNVTPSWPSASVHSDIPESEISDLYDI